MGRVVKGAQHRIDRYTVEVPVFPVDAGEGDAREFGSENGYSGFDGSDGFGSPSPFAPAPASVIDIEEIRAQAQAVIDEATANADLLLNDAHERGRAMIEDAAARADAIAEEARRSASDEGFAAGTRAAEHEMSEMLAVMRNLIEMTRVERHKIILSAEPELVRLAMGIAERVLHQQIALDRGVVVEMAKTAVSRLVDREQITVRVNPADLEQMRVHRDDVLALGEVKTMRVIEDQRVDRGGVVVETDAGSIDARIATQISEAKKVLHIEEDLIVHPGSLHSSDELSLTARAS